MSALGASDGRMNGIASSAAERHQPDRERGGCTCGFCAWSAQHVAVMVAGELERAGYCAAPRQEQP